MPKKLVTFIYDNYPNFLFPSFTEIIRNYHL